jgi:hypothetical protein
LKLVSISRSFPPHVQNFSDFLLVLAPKCSNPFPEPTQTTP